ncbi:hypothetical protein GYA44_01525, partial [Candidatus Microgenomates bacterium]|nr:hypothetical protein [Candidatus Microgenomates bacterium]
MKKTEKIFGMLLVSFVVFFLSISVVKAGYCDSSGCYDSCGNGCTARQGTNCASCKSDAPDITDPCLNVTCEKGEPTKEGDSCFCSKDPYNLPEENNCLWNECGKKDGKTKCCLQGYYCGGTVLHDYICVRIGGASGGDSNDCNTPNKTCGTTACTYCEEAGFTCTNTGYSLGGVAECSGKTNCVNVTLKYSCYEQVPNPDNTRTVSISMGTNNISGSKVWTATQERTNFSSTNVDTETQALIQSWIPSNKTIAT